jgi:serine/threonine-protein kinase ATR
LSLNRNAILIPDQLVEELPPYMFLTAFSQLVSRICHPHPDVFRHLKAIIAYMLLVYSQQSLWMLMPVYKASSLATSEALGALTF